jgi:hypothetical protein
VLLKVLTFTVATTVCLCLAHSLGGRLALEGAAVGAGAAFVLCAISHLLLRGVRKAQGNAMLAAVFGSTLASFAFVIVAVLLLNSLWPEILQPATLTLLGVYLAVRFADALRAPGALATYVPELLRGPRRSAPPDGSDGKAAHNPTGTARGGNG